MAGLHVPLPTLRRHPRGCLRTARGRCGSLHLHRGGLAPPTPCRSPGALSVNNVYRRGYASESDDGSGQHAQCLVGTVQLFVADEQLTEASKPRVGDFDDPAARTLSGGALLVFDAAWAHMRRVVAIEHFLMRGTADKAGVGAQVLAPPRARGRSWHRDGVQGRGQFAGIISV